MFKERLVSALPAKLRERLDPYVEALSIFTEVRDPRVLGALGPAGVRGLVLQRGKQGVPTKMPAHHAAHFDWTYPSDHPEMAELYRRAKQGQWDSDVHLPWKTSVDPLNPEVPLLPEDYFEWAKLEGYGVRLDAREKKQFIYSMTSWMLSQFLHGEQGALFAAAQVTEAVQFFDGKMYGSTQVMDEGRHVEVFHRYLDEKLNKLYQINDNLFVIIDSLMTDGRWDMKFLGMQIMVEGLALGAFGLIHATTQEALIRQITQMIMQDEARHVAFGVLSLRDVYKEMNSKELAEREDFVIHASRLMHDRLLGQEVWERLGFPMAECEELTRKSESMQLFRRLCFSKIVPNVKRLGLLTPRVRKGFEDLNVIEYEHWEASA
jgi:hypothetical protein